MGQLWLTLLAIQISQSSYLSYTYTKQRYSKKVSTISDRDVAEASAVIEVNFIGSPAQERAGF